MESSETSTKIKKHICKRSPSRTEQNHSWLRTTIRKASTALIGEEGPDNPNRLRTCSLDLFYRRKAECSDRTMITVIKGTVIHIAQPLPNTRIRETIVGSTPIVIKDTKRAQLSG